MSQPTASRPVTPLLVLVFLCELAMLAGLAVVGAVAGSGVAASIGFAIALPLAAAVLWAVLLAPRASRRLPRVPRLAVKLVLFIGTGLALAAVGQPAAGLALAVIAALSVSAAAARSDQA